MDLPVSMSPLLMYWVRNRGSPTFPFTIHTCSRRFKHYLSRISLGEGSLDGGSEGGEGMVDGDKAKQQDPSQGDPHGDGARCCHVEAESQRRVKTR